jgi:hypothetical protein
MNKLYIILIVFITFAGLCNSQSKIQLDKERSLYRENKVKTETIVSSDGNKSVTKIDKDGKRVEIKGYYNNAEANIITYKYDNADNMIEESYYGYESGDGYSTYFYYDNKGNIVKTRMVGSDENETRNNYDEYGNMIETEYIEIGLSPGPPYFTEYKNVYENGNLISKENICNLRTESVYLTKYSYDNDKIILEEEFEKNCNDNTLKFQSKKSILYYENGLIKETASESQYKEGVIKSIYTYEFHKN